MSISMQLVRRVCWTLAPLYLACGALLARTAADAVVFAVALGWLGVGGVLLALATLARASRPYVRMRLRPGTYAPSLVR